MGLRDYARRNDPSVSTWKHKSPSPSPKFMHRDGRKIRIIRSKHDVRMMKLGFAVRSLSGFVPYLLGGAVAQAARSDGPSVYDWVKPSSPAYSQSTFRRTLSEDEWWRF